MKYIFTAIWGIICVSVLVYGHYHWNQQTTAVKAVQPVITVEPYEQEVDTYMELAANWPETAKEQLKQSLESEQPFKVLFVGSSSSEWEKAVTEGLTAHFGSEVIQTAQHTYDQTTKEIVAENKQLELAAEKAQLVVIEPFLLNDNGPVKIDATLANLTKIMAGITAENPDTTFILQPSYPIYLPKYYADQVAAVKQFAQENNITYLDHWKAWPATDNPDIKKYLIEGQKGQEGPNEQGYQVWGQFLLDYFINKKAN
ncbi:SGNH/GDSL hydrolase family protein [Neobacillus niacini]|uniref:SGNH/GDSL hydrolase family protein n=1 Tax=Neobacillus niacini TaxID=86668 RepID=UPI003000012E